MLDNKNGSVRAALHEVPELAGSHMDMGCQLQPLKAAIQSTKRECGGSHALPGREPGGPALAAGLCGAFLGIAMASNSKTTLGFQDWALSPSCLMK